MFSSHWRQSALLRSLYWIYISYMITFTSIWFEVNYICTMYECNRTCARKSLSGLWKMVLTLENYNAMKTPAYPMAINHAELNASRQFRWHKQYGKTLCLQSMQSASVWKFFWIWNKVTFLASNQTEFLSIFYQKIDILSITGFFPRKFLK